MRNSITIGILLILLSMGSFAQFNPATLQNSVVRVVVSVNDRESNVLTGFVWKTPTQIVTSLHGMHPTGTIKVLYMNNAWRKVRIKKVLQKADLVLLEVLPGEPAVPAGVVPISSFSADPIEFRTEIFAIGYNSGARGSSSRTLKKGLAHPPENLANLIPQKDREVLARIGFPSLDLDILYLEGSLLPGFSGSPVFDLRGRLIGIGDGGLEKGASNVSWAIPAKYLRDLEASTVTSLPPNFELIAQLFSARSTVEGSVEDMAELEKTLLQPDTPKPLKASGFEFYLTKNRSIIEMVNTSDDPDNMLKFSSEIEDFNVSLDYDNIRFDIYEDINNGVILVIPEGQQLFYDQSNETFEVRFPGNDFVSLGYSGVKDDFSATEISDVVEYVNDFLNGALAKNLGLSGFETDEDYTYWIDYGDGRKIAWLSVTGNEAVYGPGNLICIVGVYAAMLISPDKSFIALSTYFVPVDLLAFTTVNGLDCSDPGIYWQECEFVNDIFKVFSAAHLTTFAY